MNIQNDLIRRDPLTLRYPSLQRAIYSSRNKSQMAPNEKMPFHEKLGLRSNTPGKSHVFDRESRVFEEKM